MMQTRRQLARSLGWSLTVAGLAGPARVWGQSFGIEGGPPGNVFYSPCGRPFRAKLGAPYPVVDWFAMADADKDGKIDHAEFVADTLAFFKVLDLNGDGVISPQELAFYENRIAPEVLGMRVEVDGGPPRPARLLWRVQGMPGQGPGGGMYHPGGATGPETSVDPGAGTDSGPDEAPKSKPYDASGAGASPYGFFDEPEPVSAADLHFRGLISKADFLQLADVHFNTLDVSHAGYLTLATLPKTPVQRLLERASQRNHHGERLAGTR